MTGREILRRGYSLTIWSLCYKLTSISIWYGAVVIVPRVNAKSIVLRLLFINKGLANRCQFSNAITML